MSTDLSYVCLISLVYEVEYEDKFPCIMQALQCYLQRNQLEK